MSRTPDYRLGAMHKGHDTKSSVGAAWKNDDGTISIALDPFVQLSNVDGQLVLTLFPHSPPAKTRSTAARKTPPRGLPDNGDEPFTPA